ncbi:MOSC domain-containing protein [Micromonospora echinofusca]|uniref:MOSC domain-containing protein n=1 Tax=Micromonospora echinofusca TaxID=47858 RepID=A0ABS3W243_MICEH|nr:MOSC domain-containing protein [Micromonospora echinofusca]
MERLWRYPVKSMLGEEVDASGVTTRGLTGDRCVALVQRETGKVASAKHPRLWRDLLRLRATVTDTGRVRMMLPDGTTAHTDDPAADARLSALLGQPVRLVTVPPAVATLDRARPDELLRDGDVESVGVEPSGLAGAAPEGTFFDFAPIHLVTSASLDRLAALGTGRPVEPVRYRPNLVIRTQDTGFVENEWVGRELAIGDALVLHVIAPTPRCAVPTLAHGPVPADLDALRVAARHNRVAPVPELDPQPCVGAYAQVVRPGPIRVGDRVRVS